MTEPEVPSRHQWPKSALPALFGQEPALSDPWPVLRDVVARFAAEAIGIRNQALRDGQDLEGVDAEVLRASHRPWMPWQEEAEHSNAPMRVVLMGRTMAGKSSLLSALSGDHFDRIGDGRQRFSRDVFAATPTASDRIEVVDTPGVGAADGSEDFQVAFSAAIDADLILWVASSDSIQEETALALRLLGVLGKPIIVALNCRQSLEGVGRLNLLRFPDRVFGNREGLVDEIRRHMSAAGVEPLDVVSVHVLAASRALALGETDTELHAASRIDDLIESLLREQATHSESRRALRLVDGQRRQVDAFASSLAHGSTTLHANTDLRRRTIQDVHARLTRVSRSAGEGMAADIDTAVGRRRGWHLTATDFGESLQAAWDKEISELQTELSSTLGERLSQLAADVESAIAQVDAEWASVSSDEFALRELTGFNSILGNRLVRAGIGIGGALAAVGAGAALGAQIGGYLGLPTGPGAIVTSVVGGVVGAAVGVALKPLKGLVDHVFLGKDRVLRRRREEVAKQIGPVLDKLEVEYERAAGDHLEKFHDLLAVERARNEDHSAALDRLAEQWTLHGDAIRALIQELDKETTSALLRIAGRERLARSLSRATRVPGVCIVAEFENSAFWEAWLYPPDLGERLAGGRIPNAGGEAAVALSYALGLVDLPARLLRADASSAILRVAADLPEPITETWSDALTSHLGRDIHIESTRRASES